MLSPGADIEPPPGSKYAPLSTGEFMLITLLLCIPLVNIILLFIWAFSNNVNINKRNYSRAALIWMGIGIGIGIIFLLSAGIMVHGMLPDGPFNGYYFYREFPGTFYNMIM
jgi:hypothetical protein